MRYRALAPFITATLLSFGLLLWCGCGDDHPLTAGYVVSRNYHPASMTMVCVGKPVICHPIQHPERFSITLADGEHDERVIDMRREEWRHHPPGSWVCLTARCTHPRDDGDGE